MKEVRPSVDLQKGFFPFCRPRRKEKKFVLLLAQKHPTRENRDITAVVALTHPRWCLSLCLHTSLHLVYVYICIYIYMYYIYIYCVYTYVLVYVYVQIHTYIHIYKKPIFADLKNRFKHIEFSAKVLDYFLRSNKSNINQYVYIHMYTHI